MGSTVHVVGCGGGTPPHGALSRRPLDASQYELYLEAETRFVRHDHAGAITLMEQLFEEVPDDPEVATRIGEMYFAEGRTDQAMEYCERAIRMSPRFADAWLLRGRLLAEGERFEEAYVAVHEGIRLAPQNPRGRVLLSELLEQAGHDGRRPTQTRPLAVETSRRCLLDSAMRPESEAKTDACTLLRGQHIGRAALRLAEEPTGIGAGPALGLAELLVAEGLSALAVEMLRSGAAHPLVRPAELRARETAAARESERAQTLDAFLEEAANSEAGTGTESVPEN